MTQPTLPPDLALLARVVDAEPPDVQELFQYALTMLLIEDGKAQVVERRKIDCREWLTVLTVAGDLFDIVKPDVCDERLAKLQEMARAVLQDDGGESSAVVRDGGAMKDPQAGEKGPAIT